MKAVRNVLSGLGYTVTALMDRGEALMLFSENHQRFDLAVMDQTMPGMTEEDVAKTMIRIWPDIPIILCPGHSKLISAGKAMEIGIRCFIMKPFTLSEGASLIRRVLDQRRTQ